MIAHQRSDEQMCQTPADRLLEAHEGGSTDFLIPIERGAVLEEEHRPTPASNLVGCGGGHGSSSAGPAVLLHP